jgi:Domain of unknown function (DUF4157)
MSSRSTATTIKPEPKPSITPMRSSFLQRQCACGNYAELEGSCPDCQKNSLVQKKTTDHSNTSEIPLIAHEFPIQTKLTVGTPGDIYEQEADRVADEVISMSPNSVVNSAPPSIQRFTGQAAGQTDLVAPASVDRVLSSPGSPLEDGLQQDMGQRFGHDFSRVRVHTDAAAARSAQDMNANAYAVGHKIVFGSGQFAPRAHEGRRLIAHELTHVVQQERVLPQNDILSQTAQRTIFRQPSGVKVVNTPVRIVYIDTNVLDQINRGNTAAAKALLELRASGADIRISQQAYNESVVSGPTVDGTMGPDPKTATAQRLMIEEMGIKRGPSTSFSQRVDVYHKNITSSKSGGPPVSNPDIRVIAESKAAGTGELWTFDRVARKNPGNIEKPFGIKLAPETTSIIHIEGVSNYATGRKLLGLEPVTISNTGLVTSSPAIQVTGGKNALVPQKTMVSGEIVVPQRGKAVKIGGKTVEAETIHGEIPTPKPSIEQLNTLPEEKVLVAPSVGKSMVKLLVAEIALNVLLFAITYYLDKWESEKQVRKFNNDLKGLLPKVNTQLKNKEAEIMEKGKAFPLVYGNITIVYTYNLEPGAYDSKDYNEGSMIIQNVAISHQNYQTPERLVQKFYSLSSNSFLEKSLTFSVPLFEEKTAEKGASNPVDNYRQVRKDLTYPAYKVRLSAVIALYKMAKQDLSLETLVVRDLIGMLKDEDATVRLAVAAFLSGLKAKIAIQYIRAVIPNTSSDKHKELIQRYLHELEQG